MNKVKREHYVPQCYLRMFSTDERINVYDKEKNEYRFDQSIKNVACQNKFYDFSEYELNMLVKIFPDISEQYIEKFFSKDIESNLKICLDTLTDNYPPKDSQANPILSEDFKANLAVQMAYQFLRTKKIRKDINNIFKNKSYDNKNITHKLMILDEGIIKDLAIYFYKKKWSISVNNTGVPYCTSDNPIVVFNIDTGDTSINAFMAKGVNMIFYPYSSKLMVTLFDENVSSAFNELNIECIEVNDLFSIDYVNFLQIKSADNCIFFKGEKINEISFNMFSNDLINNEVSKKYDSKLNEIMKISFEMIESKKFDSKQLETNEEILKEISKNIYCNDLK